MRKEFKLVFNVLGRKHGAIIGTALNAAHVFDAVDDFQVAAGIDKAGVAGVVPAICGQHLGGGLRVFVIFLEQAS